MRRISVANLRNEKVANLRNEKVANFVKSFINDMSSMSDNHTMSHEMPEMTAEHHCGGMSPDDLTGRMLPEGHPVPEGYHKMPDGLLMKNGPMMPDMPMHPH